MSEFSPPLAGHEVIQEPAEPSHPTPKPGVEDGAAGNGGE